MQAFPVLQAGNVSKAFPGVQALADVELDVEAGAVHALIGENGAGKSTLARILAGLDQPDSGEIRFLGRAVRLRHPHEALRLGVAMIHQELMPFPALSVAENILMGCEPTRGRVGWIDRGKLFAQARTALQRLGGRISPHRLMADLSVAEMQTVEIAKALVHEARVLIMDEPTSALSAHEAEALFRVITELKSNGVAIVYVSHKLDEVLRLADTVTVLRDGRHVGTRRSRDLDADALIAMMVGRELGLAPERADVAKGETVLAVENLGRAGCFRDVTFEVGRGEVLGIAGLMGAGRTEVLSALFGLAPADAGAIRMHGRAVRIRTPGEALRHGIALVSEDRQNQGLVLEMSVKHNLTLASLGRCCRGPVVSRRRENNVADEQIRTFNIKTSSRDKPLRFLSGGNQQKVMIAKALLAEPDLLLLDEPTRGIDVAAKAEVYAIISGLAQAGKAIVLVSSELPEALGLSDRLLVMRHGSVSAELDPSRTTPEQVMKHAM